MDQSFDIQVEELQKAGCERVFAEKVSGGSTEGRVELEGMLTMLREGDQVYCSRLDRLARSLRDLIGIVDRIEKAKATLHFLHQPFDTAGPAGRLFIAMLGGFAQFDLELRRERQASGIAKARAALKYKGSTRGPSYDRATIERFYFDHGLSISLIARRLKCSRQTIYRAIEEIRAAKAKAEEKGNP